MGSSSRPASSVQTQVRQEYPAFFQPHLEDVLSSAKSEFGREYIPFPEARLTETPTSRTEALTELQDTGLARLAQPTYDEAVTGTREAGKAFPDYDIEAYMNPYRQLVTDQLLDKTRERRDIGRKSIDAAAARAGAFGGGRHGVERGLYEEGTEEELVDIQERGDMAAFANALSAIRADKTAGLQSSKQLAELGAAKREDLTKGLIGMEKAATAQQALDQQIRDVGFQEFMEQRDFPQQKLAEYSAIIRGHTPPPNRWETRDVQQAYSPLQTGIGAMTALGGLFGGKAAGGTVGYHSGDRVDGLSSLVKKPSRENNSTKDVINESIDILMGMGIASRTGGPSNPRAIEREEQREIRRLVPSIPVPSLGPEPGGIDQDRLKDLRRRGQDVAEASFSEELTETMAYGGVPGQAYTEDIGMVGGLGAVAGPQMRFAYGGVPGQPYTEDIGMMGGLAAVAGPQMRFAEGYTVPVWEDIKKVGRVTAPYLGEAAYATANVLGTPVDAASATIDYLTGLKTGAGEGAVGGSDWFKSRLDRAGVPYLDSSVDETEDMWMTAGQEAGEASARELIGTDKTEEVGFEELIQPVEKEKEKAWFEKLGLSQKETIGLGLTLMQGTPDALALAGKSLLGKKDLSELDRKYKEAMVDYANARTATEKGKSSRDMLRILSTIKKNDENFRLRIAEFAKTIADADDKWILGMYKGLEPADKMAIFGVPDMKNPGNRIAEIREKVMEFSRMNPARSRTEGVAPVVEQTGTVHGSAVREGKATGGTIPNTLSKLGISGIRKV
jgi:hypothetical protein